MTRTVPSSESVSLQTNQNQNSCKHPLDKDQESHYKPGLYLVATPIGNLGDMTHRVLDILRGVDRIACEDTRHSRILLQHYGVKTPTFSFHDHSSSKERDHLIESITAGQAIAYITDAGTPGISDPGYELVKSAIEAKLYVTHAPGPCAHIMALILSGLAPHPYYFHGFLPTKTKDRESLLLRLQPLQATLIFYESPHRLESTLSDLYQHFGPRLGAIGRELTKMYETIHRGTLQELKKLVAEKPLKGECVILIAPGVPKTYVASEVDDLIRHTLQHCSVSDTSKKISALTGIAKSDIYQRALKLSAFKDD